ncbi:MAG: TrkH family potassium uptake protein [Prevotella sp.]|nr:TrkH family potassium uptake protein [Prevotella sp.]MCM1075118.1 TrkH family potassium uptake protein [Ruminococcus sp.]
MAIYVHRSYINIVMLLRVMGWLLLVEAGFMLIPLVTAFCFGETPVPFITGVGITVSAGLVMMSLKPRSRDMGKREAVLLTAMVWVIFSLFGLIPFSLGKPYLDFTDAFFETMSGFTTTGLSIMPSLDEVPRSIIIWRCVMQWIGGLGIILFTLAIIPMLNYQGGMQMFNAEVSGITRSKLRPRVSSTAKSMWAVYFCITGAAIGLLSLTEMDIFNAICYGLTTVSTGGCATTNAGIGAWNTPWIKIIVTFFMFLGGVNFGLLVQAAGGRIKPIVQNTAFRWYCGFIVIATGVMSLSIYVSNLGDTLDDFTLDPLFQAVSIISSTGLTESDFASWGGPAISLLVFMMFVGACAGSTCGGVKIDRFVICMKNIKNEFYRMMHPNAVLTVRMNGKGTSGQMVEKAIMFLIIYVIVIGVGGTLLVFMDIPMEDAYFSTLESISNTGISVSLEGIPTDYAAYPLGAKWVLSSVMLTGRLELYTILLLLTKTFWKK